MRGRSRPAKTASDPRRHASINEPKERRLALKEQSTEEQMRDLAAAVIEALSVPIAARADDRDAAASLMRSRAAWVRGALGIVPGGWDPMHATVAVRQGIADLPVTYEPYVSPEESALCVAVLPSEWHAAGAA